MSGFLIAAGRWFGLDVRNEAALRSFYAILRGEKKEKASRAKSRSEQDYLEY